MVGWCAVIEVERPGRVGLLHNHPAWLQARTCAGPFGRWLRRGTNQPIRAVIGPDCSQHPSRVGWVQLATMTMSSITSYATVIASPLLAGQAPQAGRNRSVARIVHHDSTLQHAFQPESRRNSSKDGPDYSLTPMTTSLALPVWPARRQNPPAAWLVLPSLRPWLRSCSCSRP